MGDLGPEGIEGLRLGSEVEFDIEVVVALVVVCEFEDKEARPAILIPIGAEGGKSDEVFPSGVMVLLSFEAISLSFLLPLPFPALLDPLLLTLRTPSIVDEEVSTILSECKPVDWDLGRLFGFPFVLPFESCLPFGAPSPFVLVPVINVDDLEGLLDEVPLLLLFDGEELVLMPEIPQSSRSGRVSSSSSSAQLIFELKLKL